MINSDHQLNDTEPLDNPNGGLHHRDNVTIRSGSAGSNGSSSNGVNNHSSSSPHGTPTRSTKRKIKKVGFWDRVNHHYLRRTTRSINNSNYAKYGKKKHGASRHNNNDKLQTLLFWGVVCFVSFVFGFAWKHFTTTSVGSDMHPQLRHTADNKVPSNPYAKLNEQQKQQQHKTQHYDKNNYKNKQQQQANINSLVIPRFDTRQYMNSKKQHPQSVLLEGWNHPLAFRSFPYAKQTHGPIIKNIDSDYGGLSYHSLRNEGVFSRVILPADSDNGSLSDGDNVIIGAFDPDNIDTTSTALKSRNRKRKRTTGSYPQYKPNGTKILNDVTNQAELTSYYDDDSVNILPKSNDYKKIPRACKKPEFAYNYFPSCNAFHEHNLGRVYDDPADIVHPRPEHETYKKYLAHGFYRDVWIMEDSPWIWPQQYAKEKEYIQTQTFGVEDEKRTNEMIPKAYRSTALKTFQMKHPFSDEHWEEVQLEAIIMESMTKSPRIMNLYGHCGFSTMVEVVPIEFEEVIVPGEGYQDPDTVEKRNKDGLRPYNDFTSDEKFGYALEMAESLADLHGYDLGVIVHDDVQPCQWLHTPDRKMLKLGDFNRATIMQWDMVKNEYCKFNNGPAFANYRAPEEFAARNLNEQIDTWSFGNNIYAMITGLWNFYDTDDDSVVQKKLIDGETAYIDPRYKERSFAEKKLIELVEKTWIYDPDERINMFDAVAFLKQAIKENEMRTR